MQRKCEGFQRGVFCLPAEDYGEWDPQVFIMWARVLDPG